jgi:hypothetical protein
MISSGLGQNRISANNQGRLRDRLATADLRLSVLLDATSATGGVVYGERAPDLTLRMLNELSTSPMPATKD